MSPLISSKRIITSIILSLYLLNEAKSSKSKPNLNNDNPSFSQNNNDTENYTKELEELEKYNNTLNNEIKTSFLYLEKKFSDIQNSPTISIKKSLIKNNINFLEKNINNLFEILIEKGTSKNYYKKKNDFKILESINKIKQDIDNSFKTFKNVKEFRKFMKKFLIYFGIIFFFVVTVFLVSGLLIFWYFYNRDNRKRYQKLHEEPVTNVSTNKMGRSGGEIAFNSKRKINEKNTKNEGDIKNDKNEGYEKNEYNQEKYFVRSKNIIISERSQNSASSDNNLRSQKESIKGPS